MRAGFNVFIYFKKHLTRGVKTDARGNQKQITFFLWPNLGLRQWSGHQFLGPYRMQTALTMGTLEEK